MRSRRREARTFGPRSRDRTFAFAVNRTEITYRFQQFVVGVLLLAVVEELALGFDFRQEGARAVVAFDVFQFLAALDLLEHLRPVGPRLRPGLEHRQPFLLFVREILGEAGHGGRRGRHRRRRRYRRYLLHALLTDEGVPRRGHGLETTEQSSTSRVTFDGAAGLTLSMLSAGSSLNESLLGGSSRSFTLFSLIGIFTSFDCNLTASLGGTGRSCGLVNVSFLGAPFSCGSGLWTFLSCGTRARIENQSSPHV